MVSEKQLSLKRMVPFLIVGILIFVAYLYLFVGIPEMIAILQRVDLFYYALAVAVLFLNMIAVSLTWHFFLRPLSIKVPFKKTFLYTLIAVFVDLLVPAESVSGDATKAYLMTKGSGEKGGCILASVVGHRILHMLIPLVSLIFSIFVVYARGIEIDFQVLILIILVTIGIAISVFVIFLFSVNEKLTQKLIDKVLRFVGFVTRGRLDVNGLKVSAIKALCAFHDSIDILRRNPKSFILPTLFALAGWLFSILLSYLVFISLGQQIDFVIIVVVQSISVSIQSIPIGIPGELGVVDSAMTWLYTLLAVESAVGAAATVLIQILRVWLRITVGFVAVQWIDLKDLTKHLRRDLSGC
jgi:uncharacterized protein (TIRG00374 family)